jgi:nucleoid DNA-binding protein
MKISVKDILAQIKEENPLLSEQDISKICTSYIIAINAKLKLFEEFEIKGLGKFKLTYIGEKGLEKRKKHERKLHTRKIVKYLNKTRYSWMFKFIDDLYED